MGTIKSTVGFTIIETMMFLAITGLLAVGILAGTGAAIAQQRYKDSVNSLQSFMQDQFSKVTNVTNGRDNTWSCNAGVVAQENGESRGTGDCVILGRLVSVDNTGQQLTASDVVAQHKSGVAEQASDIAELTKSYDIAVSPIDTESSDVAWGATIVQPRTTDPQPTNILIVRSPLTGRIMTFVSQSTETNLVTLIKTGFATTPTPLCLEPSDGVGGVRLGVRIGAYAASQSAIQVAPESENLCA
jgi:Tfp pilus assembly protein FimT